MHNDMSLINEIHNQKPSVRYALFGLAAVTALSIVVYFGFTALQRNMFMALNSNEEERQEFLASQEARRPKPFAALARAAGSLTASIGSLLNINHEAGFDRGGQQDNTQDGVHLLPLSK